MATQEEVAEKTSLNPAPSESSAPRQTRSSDEWELIQQKTHTGHRPSLRSKLAALYFNVFFIGGIHGLLLALWLCTMLPLLWPVFIAYIVWLWGGWGMRAPCNGSYPTPLKRWGMWRACAAYFPARLHKTAELPPDKPYIFCCHPHGIFSYSHWLTFATDALGFSRLFPGINPRTLTLSINFKGPFFREYLLLHGVCDVSKHTCLRLLSTGKSIMIAVGGGAESLYARPGANDLVLQRRKGFVKIALRTGAPLVPVYAFGENSTFRTANFLPPNSLLRRFQRRMNKLTGFTIPIYHGTGLLLPWGFLPFPVPLDVVVGAPLEVPKFEGSEDSAEFAAQVDRHHARYVAALRQLFEDNRDKFAKGEADLQIVE